jgi:hypothetical protein
MGLGLSPPVEGAHLRCPVTQWGWHVFHLGRYALQPLKRAAPLSLLQVGDLQTVVCEPLSIPNYCGMLYTEGGYVSTIMLLNPLHDMNEISHSDAALLSFIILKIKFHAICWQVSRSTYGLHQWSTIGRRLTTDFRSDWQVVSQSGRMSVIYLLSFLIFLSSL